MTDGKITSFKDLVAWQEGHKLVLCVYELTKKFPNDEKFALIDQLRRAMVSITSNIAEGFSRKTAKDKASFYQISLGSLTEVENQMIIAKDLGYIAKSEFDECERQIITCSKIIHGLVKSTRVSNF